MAGRDSSGFVPVVFLSSVAVGLVYSACMCALVSSVITCDAKVPVFGAGFCARVILIVLSTKKIERPFAVELLFRTG